MILSPHGRGRPRRLHRVDVPAHLPSPRVLDSRRLARSRDGSRPTRRAALPALDTLARVYFLRGDRDRALTLQRKAVEVAPERQKRSMREALAEYEKAAAG